MGMGRTGKGTLVRRTLKDLTIEDEPSFRHVGLYADLKKVLQDAEYTFRVLPESLRGFWDRALFLNLTFWGASTNGAGVGTSEILAGGDVLVDDSLPADVVAHVAWHHLAAKALSHPSPSPSPSPSASKSASKSASSPAPLSADALFLGESIASAFDVYLVGRLLGHSPNSTFLSTQVSAMAETANAAGMGEDAFGALLQGIAADPERAFEDLRQLLFDATTTLAVSNGVDEALEALTRFESHRFEPLLHHYELSNWVLYARAYARESLAQPDEQARQIDRSLREADVALDWLTSKWIEKR